MILGTAIPIFAKSGLNAFHLIYTSVVAYLLIQNSSQVEGGLSYSHLRAVPFQDIHFRLVPLFTGQLQEIN